VVAPPAKKVVAKPPSTNDQKKPPFYFYMQIRKSELKQERTLQEQGHPEASDQKLPNTQVEITKHIQSEWKMLTDDQKGRFDIPMETQTELKRRKQTEDVEILRQLVLT